MIGHQRITNLPNINIFFPFLQIFAFCNIPFAISDHSHTSLLFAQKQAQCHTIMWAFQRVTVPMAPALSTLARLHSVNRFPSTGLLRAAQTYIKAAPSTLLQLRPSSSHGGLSPQVSRWREYVQNHTEKLRGLWDENIRSRILGSPGKMLKH